MATKQSRGKPSSKKSIHRAPASHSRAIGKERGKEGKESGKGPLASASGSESRSTGRRSGEAAHQGSARRSGEPQRRDDEAEG